ncbi:MAG: oligoribonuclease [Lentisphaeria bacterium]
MLSAKNLIWIDLEMTGLKPETDRILEMATIITDSELTILAEGPVIAVHQSNETLSKMDAWNQQHHGQSGLVDRVRESKIDEKMAEKMTLDFVQKWVPCNTSPICGNSVGQDRRFLYEYMPELERYLHYRNLDVSTLKILAQNWKPEILPGFTKKEAHQALDDIRESIAELQYYRNYLIKS